MISSFQSGENNRKPTAKLASHTNNICIDDNCGIFTNSRQTLIEVYNTSILVAAKTLHAVDCSKIDS